MVCLVVAFSKHSRDELDPGSTTKDIRILVVTVIWEEEQPKCMLVPGKQSLLLT